MKDVATVTGTVPVSELGITLPHEHIIINLNEAKYTPGQREQGAVKVSMENMWRLHRDPNVSVDNLRINEVKTAVDELREFDQMGGRTIVDLTPSELGRDLIKIKRISLVTGVRIIASTGWYVRSTHPDLIKKMSVIDLKEKMVKEIEIGIDDTGIKAGVIGEIGCSEPVPFHKDERKVLTAAAMAQSATGVPLTVHPSLYDSRTRKRSLPGFSYIEILEKTDAALEKFYLSHSDFTCSRLDYHRKLMDKGIILSYDCFGKELYYESWFPGARGRTDWERIESVVQLCKEGYDSQILLSQDICFKIGLKKYGGYGYSHILRNIVPELIRQGVKKKQIRKMLMGNPERLFSRS